jgi:hypothetical protein
MQETISPVGWHSILSYIIARRTVNYLLIGTRLVFSSTSYYLTNRGSGMRYIQTKNLRHTYIPSQDMDFSNIALWMAIYLIGRLVYVYKADFLCRCAYRANTPSVGFLIYIYFTLKSELLYRSNVPSKVLSSSKWYKSSVFRVCESCQRIVN